MLVSSSTALVYMNDENITASTQPDDAQLTPADVQAAVGDVANPAAAPTADAISLEDLNKLFGKKFPNRETALKSIGDTYSYVGKKKEDVKKEVEAELASIQSLDELNKRIAQMEKERFFDQNPQYKSQRKLIEKLGSNPAEVVNLPEFKEVYEKVVGYESLSSKKTVLESNPRIAQSVDAINQARQLAQKGAPMSDVENIIGAAVLKAHER